VPHDTRIKNALKILVHLVALALVAFLGYRACHQGEPDPQPGIIKQHIVSNTVSTDVSGMSIEELREALQCFYTGQPMLDIYSLGGEDYSLSAGLCERSWERQVRIQGPRNYWSAGMAMVISSGYSTEYGRIISGLYTGIFPWVVESLSGLLCWKCGSGQGGDI
jgi:hypothetical protein